MIDSARKKTSSLFPPGNLLFDQVFPTWTSKQGVQVLWQGQGATVLGADFTLLHGDTGDKPLLGHLTRGRVRKAVVDALVEQSWLARKVTQGGPVIWAIHFEPGADDATLELLDEGLLRDAIVESDGAWPAAILSGHTHLMSRKKLFAGQWVFCCGSTLQKSVAGNWLNVIEIDGAKVTLRPCQFVGGVFVGGA